MFKQNLKAVLNTQRPDKTGRYPLRIRQTVQRVVTYHSTGVMLMPEQLVDGDVVKHPNKVQINALIRSRITEIEKQFLEEAITGASTESKNLKFVEYAEKKIAQWSSSQSRGSTIRRTSDLNKFKQFKAGIRLKDVTSEVLINYEQFCRARGNADNTIWGAIKFVRTIINAAIKERLIKEGPVGYEGPKYNAPLRKTLSTAELLLFEEFANNPAHSSKLRNVANWFLFSCYTSLRYGDLAAFKGFSNGKVLLLTEKTKEVVSIFATSKIKQIHAGLTAPIISNQKFNDYVKTVAVSVGIEKHVTCHTARHTFAVQFLERGGRLEILSKLLGHTNIKTTQVYAKISTQLADAEMRKVWGD